MLYANVDQNGNLGSNVGAVRVQEGGGAYPNYVVTFDRSIVSCAATAQAGYADGDLVTHHFPSIVEGYSLDDDAFIVAFFDPGNNNNRAATAFMLTVTCPT